ncbi:hypothetical protein BS47DRAFT_1373595 [Hydnum rufescens UP504]|uniref:Tc1-like transposase DDE domain-containing protein n=1 Tax=Hydnum rufescens UP504 TaxID=1448309 RepID=A0A9P6ANB7_9AGAM|nr:hypothetical protein BS47DRAFT_1373595 [Hydnum rufescens UP504]
MEECERRTRKWDGDGQQVMEGGDGASYPRWYLTIWFHDECIFYAHDHHVLCWVHSSETSKPYAKGEGQSLMIANFISADYGWLSSADGNESVHVKLKPGKNHHGYFSNDELLMQVEKAAHLVHKLYPNDDHVFIFDNAHSHSKHAEDALSAHYLSKGTSKPTDGKPIGVHIPMGDACFADGHSQPLYFPPGHPTHPGLFKGMVCTGFKCQKNSNGEYGPWCCQCILFNEPDFANVPSLLSTLCTKNNIPAIFLPNFSPELNPIEQCWGYAKQIYCEFPPSSAINDVIKNAQKALASVPLECIQKLWNRSLHYEDSWTSHHYHSHRALPPEATKEMISELIEHTR